MTTDFTLGLSIIIVAWMAAWKVHNRNFKSPEPSWLKVIAVTALPWVVWAAWKVVDTIMAAS